jgi:VCBS repeat-containing protein
VVTITIDDLAEGYLALTTGTTITLDRDAAGYGWFIDQTPLRSEEFAAGSTPWQFTALEGSVAAGKIDLMTVLMHELGHVMNLGHVSSAVDGTRLMAGSIDPGIRRLPSALDLGMPSAQSSAVSTQQPDPAAVWAPYLTHYTMTASGDSQPAPVVNPATLVQAAHTPSHAGIFNSGFGITDPANAHYGWDRSGALSIANGQATLFEDSNVISTLSQLFTLPAGSTHLRFTLVDANLNSNGATRPQDAFEVALLEASTLTPLAGVTAGLTQTDSLFNLQQDGTVRFSNRVTLSNSTTSGAILDLTQPVLVDIDLTGIATGAGARLSFDLLGFGDRTSTITIDSVLLTDGQPAAAPVANNDAYSVAEGATLAITAPGLLSNDTDADTAAVDLASAIVTGPTHGTVTLNADGSFSYRHDGSETLTDSFTYRVSDGLTLSNVATVSLTITPTNDAPSIPVMATQSVEQGRTLSVTVQATDPDDSNVAPESNALTYSLGTGAPAGASIDPSTGVFTWAVPRTQTIGLTSVTVIVTDAGTPALSATRTVTIDVTALTNTSPALDPIGAKTVNEDTELRFTISATDADVPTQTLAYSAADLPAGATFDIATREFVWTPTEVQGGGSYEMTFRVTDGEFSASELVTITVEEVNVAPVGYGDRKKPRHPDPYTWPKRRRRHWSAPCRSLDCNATIPRLVWARRGARVVESTCLESMRLSNGTVGSNPTLSAIQQTGA